MEKVLDLSADRLLNDDDDDDDDIYTHIFFALLYFGIQELFFLKKDKQILNDHSIFSVLYKYTNKQCDMYILLTLIHCNGKFT